MRVGSLDFRRVWLVDFEFTAAPGELPVPICMVARELVSGQQLRLWEHELRNMITAPYDLGPDSLLVGYYTSAEIGCHLALGWAVPANILDLYVEFRNLTNGRDLPCGNSLLVALTWFGLDGIEVAEKEEMRSLALRGGPWSEQERITLLNYCQSDVVALAKLLERMNPVLDVERALLRGHYMGTAARMEHIGIPIDCKKLADLRKHWDEIKYQLIREVDAGRGIYQGSTFKVDNWTRFLAQSKMTWPRLQSGALALDDETFREMAQLYPVIEPYRQLRTALSEMRLADLAVGRDGRNRCLLSPYRSRTGRNQPSNSKFVFGPAVWLRSLIRPTPGFGLACLDWSQQEFGIAAALSGDKAMMSAYGSGDPYLALARQAGAVPLGATKATHGRVRDQFKQCALAVQYGMGDAGLAQRIGQPTIVGRDLIRLHRQTYPKFWKWSDHAVDYAMLNSRLFTVVGWNIHAGPGRNPRFLRDFPMQANGAEMLRLACCLAVDQGIEVCAPIHDAILIQAPLDRLDHDVVAAEEAMAQASALVLKGFRLRSEAKLFRYLDRYSDERGKKMWDMVERLLAGLTS